MAGLEIMNQISVRNLVKVVLGSYLVYVIIMANLKLQSDQIGTIFRIVSKKTVQASKIVIFASYLTNFYTETIP